MIDDWFIYNYLAKRIIDIRILPIRRTNDTDLAGQNVRPTKPVYLSDIRAAKDIENNLVPKLRILWKFIFMKINPFTGPTSHDDTAKHFHFSFLLIVVFLTSRAHGVAPALSTWPGTSCPINICVLFSHSISLVRSTSV